MKEILPGIWNWRAPYDRPRGKALSIPPVDCYFVPSAGALIDPMVPEEGIEWFAEYKPERVLLTTARHPRHAQKFVDAYGCSVHVHNSGVNDGRLDPSTASVWFLPWDVIDDINEVTAFEFGDTIAPGITACEMGEIWTSDAAFHINIGQGALVFGDGLLRWPAEYGGAMYLLSIPPAMGGRLPGVTADRVKAANTRVREVGLKSLRRLIDEQTFDALLFTHGDPILTDGKAALTRFLNSKPGRIPLRFAVRSILEQIRPKRRK